MFVSLIQLTCTSARFTSVEIFEKYLLRSFECLGGFQTNWGLIIMAELGS